MSRSCALSRHRLGGVVPPLSHWVPRHPHSDFSLHTPRKRFPTQRVPAVPKRPPPTLNPCITQCSMYRRMVEYSPDAGARIVRSPLGEPARRMQEAWMRVREIVPLGTFIPYAGFSSRRTSSEVAKTASRSTPRHLHGRPIASVTVPIRPLHVLKRRGLRVPLRRPSSARGCRFFLAGPLAFAYTRYATRSRRVRALEAQYCRANGFQDGRESCHIGSRFSRTAWTAGSCLQHDVTAPRVRLRSRAPPSSCSVASVFDLAIPVVLDLSISDARLFFSGVGSGYAPYPRSTVAALILPLQVEHDLSLPLHVVPSNKGSVVLRSQRTAKSLQRSTRVAPVKPLF
ncbi:hypothetical protein C8R45DRAFT_1113323 [Mycena sanguinolenta]|nr:hypothetical protein C8R45DRAFT_1113323 [Mycena sanguinolenta]